MLHNADARDVLASLGDGSVDCIVTDPPYRTISGGSGPSEMHRRPVGMLAGNAGDGGFEHNDIRFEEYIPELYRVLSDPAHLWIFTNELNRRPMEDALLSAGFRIHYLGGWVKNTCTPNRWGMKNCEPFFVARKGAARGFYTPSIKQFLHHNNLRHKLHPTEKPLGLIRDMVLASSRPMDLVLDPFMGAGSTAVVCKHGSRRFIGAEIDKKYYDIARIRAL